MDPSTAHTIEGFVIDKDSQLPNSDSNDRVVVASYTSSAPSLEAVNLV